MKRPATAIAEDAQPKTKHGKRAEGLYARFKGKSIPEPRLPARKKMPSNACKAIVWNVGGLRALLGNRPQLLRGLVRTEKPAVLGFLEHKLQEGEQVKAATEALGSLLPDYTCARFACSKKKLGYSGVAVLLRKDVAPKAKVVSVKLETGADEGRTICVEMPKFFIVFSYVVNSGDGLVRLKERLGQWDKKLRSYLQGLAKRKPVVLL